MARPLRIEYPNAVYHVMNRGQARTNIFHGKIYTDAFLKTLAEAHQKFSLETLAYCLMNNHYHLLLRTPKGNLSRCMRHINGIYTQKYNKLRQIDGPLFRGRYKSILVETDEYLLPVSRYIHRNPIETKNPVVKYLREYKLSSYPAYINDTKTPTWLNKQFILDCMNTRKSTQAYKNYVLKNNDNALTSFYQKQHLPSILGDMDFIENVKQHTLATDTEISGRQILNTMTLGDIIALVAKIFSCNTADIVTSNTGTKTKNHPRQTAMLLAKRHTELTLPVLAEYFNVSNYSTISKQAARLLNEIETNTELASKVMRLYRLLEKN